jgi:aldose 1-epimerase
MSIDLEAGSWRARFLPELGMVGVSLAFDGTELLSLRGGLDAYRLGHTVGMPLLAPWANRLSAFRFELAGEEVDLATAPGVHLEEHGLPNHGTMAAQPGWEVVRQDPARLTARFAYERPDLLAAFPFPHELEIDVTLADGLRVTTAVTPTGGRPVPISFGWHPYYVVPGDRRSWTLGLPPRRRIELDDQAIPTGREEPREAGREPLGERAYDDHYALGDQRRFTLEGDGLALAVEYDEGYPYAQLFAPPGSSFVAIEPMTAPTNALVSGRFRLVEPGERFAAAFAVAAN